MESAMNTWDIAKQLIQSCNSPDDVRKTLSTLRNPKEVERVCELLTAFSVEVPATQTHQSGKSNGNALANNGVSPKKTKGSAKKTGLATTTSTEETIAVKLEPLFRDRGMTNIQVEEWFATNFSVATTVGKSSLRKFLIRVLDSADLGTKNRIMAAAHQLGSDTKNEDSDLVKYWDGFDKHFGVSE